MESLQAILTKSPPPNQQISPTATTPAISIPPRPVLQYPSVEVPGSSAASASPAKSSFEYGSSPPRSSTRFGTFFKTFRGRSAFDADDDEFDSTRKYSTVTLKTDAGTSNSGKKPNRGDVSDPDGGRAHHSPLPYPLATPITPPPKTKTKTKNFFASFNGRSAFDADDDEFDDQRKYTIDASPAVSRRGRAISWADETANANPAASGDVSEQAGRSEDGDESSSTVSVTSTSEHMPIVAQLSLATPRFYQTIKKSQGKLMSAILKAARGISPYQGNMWDPEEDEWMDASKVVETFKASYKTPVSALPSPTKGALSYFGTAIQSTVKSVLGSAATRKKEEERGIEEEVREKVEDLGNTCLYDPKGDANDEVMKSVFLGPTRFFPAQQPYSPRHAHIVDLNTYFQSFDPLISHARPRLCDAIATVLSHTSRECLEAFLDPSIKEFIYRRKVDNNEGGLILIIRREGNEVICGAYHNLAFKKLWNLYVKSVISITGQWHEVFAVMNPGEMVINKGMPDWDTIQRKQSEVQSDKADSKAAENTQRKLELSPKKKIAQALEDVKETNPKFMLYQSRVLAVYLLWDIWYRFDGMYKCWATWMADGEESKVRLKRALVGSEDEEDD
jgi:hypothetical protein